MEEHIKREDVHGSPALTRWVHHHRRLARWFLKIIVIAITSLLYYLRRQEKIIDQEVKKDK